MLVTGGLIPPTSSSLTDDGARGNLIAALDPLQAVGIWPAGDFRVRPQAEWLAYVLIAVALALAVVGLAFAWRRRAWAMLLAAAGGGIGCLALALAGSPWVDGKAFATISPIVLLMALAGAVAVAGSKRRFLGIAGAAGLVAGVLWSNVLAYRDVSLAPRDQLAELEELAGVIAGEGPALMTEYSPYGARHFLRDADAEAVSELRRRAIPRRDGDARPQGRCRRHR